jgi:hypothetical protein
VGCGCGVTSWLVRNAHYSLRPPQRTAVGGWRCGAICVHRVHDVLRLGRCLSRLDPRWMATASAPHIARQLHILVMSAGHAGTLASTRKRAHHEVEVSGEQASATLKDSNLRSAHNATTNDKVSVVVGAGDFSPSVPLATICGAPLRCVAATALASSSLPTRWALWPSGRLRLVTNQNACFGFHRPPRHATLRPSQRRLGWAGHNPFSLGADVEDNH